MTRLRPAGFGGASLSFSGSRFAAWYFLVQALGIAAWWIYLSAEPSAVPMFLPRGAAEALRNPMVVAGLGQGLAVALWFGSWAVLAYVLVGGIIWV
jgi:hypothetical protein